MLQKEKRQPSFFVSRCLSFCQSDKSCKNVIECSIMWVCIEQTLTENYVYVFLLVNTDPFKYTQLKCLCMRHKLAANTTKSRKNSEWNVKIMCSGYKQTEQRGLCNKYTLHKHKRIEAAVYRSGRTTWLYAHSFRSHWLYPTHVVCFCLRSYALDEFVLNSLVLAAAVAVTLFEMTQRQANLQYIYNSRVINK